MFQISRLNSHRLVGQLAQSNLKASQKSLKDRHDKYTTERALKPGGKVLVLIPIPGRSLQTRYFGPYIVGKKLSDLIYVLKTPDRHRRNQLCYVNMLKADYGRKSTQIMSILLHLLT